MTPEELAKLKQAYTARTVMVHTMRPELARWANVPGKVVMINCNGRALVQFEGADQAWYDIEPEYLDLLEPDARQPAETEKEKV
jgi:hypothetical protein